MKKALLVFVILILGFGCSLKAKGIDVKAGDKTLTVEEVEQRVGKK